MATHTTLTSLFSDIANSIRSKTGSSELIVADNFPTAISQIPTDPSGECTATDADILSGKTAYAGNQLRTGTIPHYNGEIVSGWNTNPMTSAQAAILYDWVEE